MREDNVPVFEDEQLNIAVLEKMLNTDTSFDEFAISWLKFHCTNMSAIDAGVLLIRNSESHIFKPEAKWPLKSDVRQLAEIAYAVIDEKCGLIVPIEELSKIACAYPVTFKGELHGVVALQIDSLQEELANRVMSQLQWSVAWVELYLLKHESKSFDEQALRSKKAIEILAKVQSQSSSEAAIQSLISLLASDFDFDRVSYGVHEKGKTSVLAVSHTAKFGKRMGLLAAIQRAMEESFIAGEEIFFPSESSELRAIDHKALLESSESSHVLSIPVYSDGQCLCILTLEGRRQTEKYALEFIRAVATLCVPAVEDKRSAQQSIFSIVRQRGYKQLKKLFGPKYAGRKLALVLGVAALVFFSVAKGEYRLSADTVLEGEIQRVLAAPYSGYVSAASAKAGDEVKSGQVIYQLDDRELRLEKSRWLSEKAKYRHQYDNAYAKKQSADMNISRAQMEQANAQLALTDDKLNRSRVMAPFDGLILTGDLSQRLGDFVEQGEVLFELAPLDSYRIILLVEDKRINDVKLNQQGHLVMTALPGEKFPFTITSITSETEAKEGSNFFRVEAALNGDGLSDEHRASLKKLRPGMQGVGKISVDRRRLIGIWTRSFREWLSLALWKWL